MKNLLNFYEVFIKHLKTLLVNLTNLEAVFKEKKIFLIDLELPEHDFLLKSQQKIYKSEKGLFLIFEDLKLGLKIANFESRNGLTELHSLVNRFLYRKIRNMLNYFLTSCLSYRSLKKENILNLTFGFDGELQRQEGQVYPELK